MMMERYYIKVKGEEGSRIPHDTLAEAYAEARRLFDLIGRNRRVYVLQVVGTIDPEETEDSRTPGDTKGRTGPRGAKLTRRGASPVTSEGPV